MITDYQCAPNLAGACAANTEQRLVAQEQWEELYEQEQASYKQLLDWQDIAAQTEDMVPVLLALVHGGQLATAQHHLEQMIDKAAKDHAALVADKREVGAL